MQFSITITGDESELTPAVQSLVTALAKGNAAVKVDKPKKDNKSKPDKKPDPVEETEDESSADPDEPEESEEEVEIPSDVQLRETANDLTSVDPKLRPKIKKLLAEFDVPNLTALPKDKTRIKFLQRLYKL